MARLPIKHETALKRLLPVLSILLIAVAVRIVTSSAWSVSAPHLGVVLSREIAQDRHPPLYFFTLSVWERLAGDSRLALPMLMIICG
jgi:hypothetical protein